MLELKRKAKNYEVQRILKDFNRTMLELKQ